MPDPDRPTSVENLITHRREDFERLLECAAERGAERALAHLGIANGQAAHDIHELRNLLDAWRKTRHTAWHTIIKASTIGLLTIFAIGAAIKFKLTGGAP